MQLNQVLGLATGTIESVIQPLGAATGDVGDDEADIEAFGGGLDARSHASLAVPGFGAVASLGIAAQRLNLFLGSANPDIIGGLLDQSVEDFVAGQAENVIDPVGLAERHHFRAAVMAVAADGQPRMWPMLPDPAD